MLRPVSERKHPLPRDPSQADGGRKKELKGILKNLQNLADIERSVANLYSQVDKNCKVPRFTRKTEAAEKSGCINELPTSGSCGEQSVPETIDFSAAVQISPDSSENGLSEMNEAAEALESSQLNCESPKSDPSEHLFSQSTFL